MIPANARYITGVTQVGGDQLNTFVQICTNATQLRLFIGAANMSVLLEGISAPNDGSGGFFIWNSSVTGPDDNQNVIVPSGSSQGAWVRQSLTSLVPPSQIAPVSGNYTAGAFDAIIEANAGAGALTITVPRSRKSGVPVIIVKVDNTSNAVGIQDDASTGLGALTFPAVNGVYNSATAYSNGTSVKLI